MKKLITLVFAAFLVCAFTAFAQKAEENKEEMNQSAPPKPLDDEMHSQMIGEWEGTTESNMGTSTTWQKCEWGLGKQYVIVHMTNRTTKMNPEMVKMQAEQMKMSEKEVEKMMTSSTYDGMGIFSLDARTGEYVGYWFDNWRGAYTGKGNLEGEKVVMAWDGTMGKSVRTMSFEGKEKMIETFSEEMGGMKMEGITTLTRKKK